LAKRNLAPSAENRRWSASVPFVPAAARTWICTAGYRAPTRCPPPKTMMLRRARRVASDSCHNDATGRSCHLSERSKLNDDRGHHAALDGTGLQRSITGRLLDHPLLPPCPPDAPMEQQTAVESAAGPATVQFDGTLSNVTRRRKGHLRTARPIDSPPDARRIDVPRYVNAVRDRRQ
jgi:hypothetical protein